MERVLKLNYEGYGDMGPNGIPHMFLDLLSNAPIERPQYYYWWRAQSLAYMVFCLPQSALEDIRGWADVTAFSVRGLCGHGHVMAARWCSTLSTCLTESLCET